MVASFSRMVALLDGLVSVKNVPRSAHVKRGFALQKRELQKGCVRPESLLQHF
jgi:hypothetical protein